MRFSYFFPLVIFLALAAFLLKGLFIPQDAPLPSVLINKPLPAFTLPTLTDNNTLKNTDFHGKFALLNVFASWCVSCRIEHGLLMQLADSRLVPIYGISWKDKPEDTQKWLDKHGNPYTTIGTDIDGQVIIDLGVTGAPETFVVSPDGTIIYKYAGPLTTDIISNEIFPRMEQYYHDKK